MCQRHGTDVYEWPVRCDVLRPFVSSLVLSPGFATGIRISSPFPSTPAGPAERAPLGAQGSHAHVCPANSADGLPRCAFCADPPSTADRKSTRLNSSHSQISYAVFCLKKKK